jgi:hypothetical protein
MPPFSVVAGLFALSLLSAVVLFKFLKSTALIKNANYQAGGAIAGFIIVYGMLHWSYGQNAGYDQTIATQKQTIDDKDAELQKLRQFTHEVTLSGTITPSTQDTLVQITAWEAPTDISGAFSLKAPCLQGSDQAKLLITQNGQYYMKYVTLGGPVDVHLPK